MLKHGEPESFIFTFLSMYSSSKFGFYKDKLSPSFQFQPLLPSSCILRDPQKTLRNYIFLTMPSLIQRILSLTIIIFFSLAYSDGFDVKAGDVAQPLMETPGADTLDRLGNPTLGLEATGEADDWGKIADTNYGSTRQAVVAEPNNHGCSNTNGRRREIGESCPFNGAPLELRPFSAQERKSTSGEQLRKARSRKKGAIPGSPATPGPTRDPNCPPGSWAVCGASDLIHDFLNPGTYHEVPWPLDNIPSIIEVQHFCRFCALAGL